VIINERSAIVTEYGVAADILALGFYDRFHLNGLIEKSLLPTDIENCLCFSFSDLYAVALFHGYQQ